LEFMELKLQNKIVLQRGVVLFAFWILPFRVIYL
jgi:hypothetical protein